MGLRSALGAAVRHLAGRLNPATIAREVYETATDRFIPQGSAELGRALFSEHQGYEPYGPLRGNDGQEVEKERSLADHNYTPEHDKDRSH